MNEIQRAVVTILCSWLLGKGLWFCAFLFVFAGWFLRGLKVELWLRAWFFGVGRWCAPYREVVLHFLYC